MKMICKECGIMFNEEDSNAKDTIFCHSSCEDKHGVE